MNKPFPEIAYDAAMGDVSMSDVSAAYPDMPTEYNPGEEKLCREDAETLRGFQVWLRLANESGLKPNAQETETPSPE